MHSGHPVGDGDGAAADGALWYGFVYPNIQLLSLCLSIWQESAMVQLHWDTPFLYQ